MDSDKGYVIVVGIDYSDTSDLALERAFELASQKAKAEVHIVHVVATAIPVTPLDLGVAVPSYDADAIEVATRILRDYADAKLQSYQDSVGSSQRLFYRAVSHLRFDAPAHEIAQLASDLQADLVVVGTHGRKGAARLLLGSVAEQVVRHSPCAVLVVRQPIGTTETSAEKTENVPQIEPPCPRCLAARRASGGQQMWCEQHSTRHGERHFYHYSDRVGEGTNFPLVVPR